MSDTDQKEVKAISRLLVKTADLAEQASLTGSFEDGMGRCIHQYNVAVIQLERLGAVPTGFFLPLPESAGYGSIGIACAQIASYIGEEAVDAGVSYHGPKYNIMNNKGGGMATEQLEELKALRELLHHQHSERREA